MGEEHKQLKVGRSPAQTRGETIVSRQYLTALTCTSPYWVRHNADLADLAFDWHGRFSTSVSFFGGPHRGHGGPWRPCRVLQMQRCVSSLRTALGQGWFACRRLTLGPLHAGRWVDWICASGGCRPGAVLINAFGMLERRITTVSRPRRQWGFDAGAAGHDAALPRDCLPRTVPLRVKRIARRVDMGVLARPRHCNCRSMERWWEGHMQSPSATDPQHIACCGPPIC